MSIEFDEDEVPQFPWPMWIPVLSWLVHGIALVGGAVYYGIEISKPYQGFSPLPILLMIGLASFFLVAGCSTLRGRPRCFSLAVFLSCLYFGMASVYFLSKGPLTGDRLYFLIDAVALFTTAIIALTFHSQLVRWCLSRRNQADTLS